MFYVMEFEVIVRSFFVDMMNLYYKDIILRFFFRRIDLKGEFKFFLYMLGEKIGTC